VAETSRQQAPAGTVPNPATGTAGHDVAKPKAAEPRAAEPKAAEPKAAEPKAAGSGTANHDAATVPGNHDVANDVANRKIANDEAVTPKAPDHPGKHAAPAFPAAQDTTAPAFPVAAGTDPGPSGPSVPAAMVHPGQVAPTTGVPAPAGAPAPAPAAVPVPVQQQVFAAVGPLLREDDGSYAVQVQLHPHDLGAVQVTVDVRHGEISVQLHSPDPAAQDALRDGLSDLRRQLEDQGLRTGSMEVGSGGADPRQRDGTRPQPFAVRVATTGAPLAGTSPLVPTPAGSTALDLRM
jgi:flagellar hook-length control protein FliK